MEFVSGQEFSIEDTLTWTTVLPQAGQIVELCLQATDLTVMEELWGGFFVQGSQNNPDRSLTLVVRHLGSETEEAGLIVEERFQGGEGSVHLCLTSPCAVVEASAAGGPRTIHVTKLRWWLVEDYMGCAYLNVQGRNLISALVTALAAEATRAPGKSRRPREAKEPKEPKKRETGRPAAPRAKKGAAPKPGATTSKKKAPDDDQEAGPGRRFTEDMQARLRARLADVRAAHGVGADKGKKKVGPQEEEDVFDVEASDSASGGSLTDEEVEETQDPPAKKVKKKKAHKALMDLQEGDRLGLVTRGGTMKASKKVENQLVQRALMTAQDAEKQQKKKKKKSKAVSGEKVLNKLGQVIKEALTGEKGAPSKKERKRSRRVLPDGTIVSSSNSSSSTSASKEEEKSSESEYEAPLRKKSQDKPGSVLTMLTDHVKETLEQGALTSVGSRQSSVTSGIKVMTYFMPHVKPAFQVHQREMREMHHLAAVIDTLRRGDLAVAGDALAARFVALHQSLLDAGWQTARHMELYPLEDTSAASPAVVLATRRHSKLVAKAQGWTPSFGWGSAKGRGRGGRGDWGSNYENKGENKGDKGKGKKGKGKGRGRGDQHQGDSWKDKKEKPEEKVV